jgi:hypothetical protein
MKITHRDRVLARIREIGYVDNVWCFQNHILRLGDIIFRLRKDGYDFTTDMPPDKNCHYYLKGQPPEKEKKEIGFVTIAGKRIEIYK